MSKGINIHVFGYLTMLLLGALLGFYVFLIFFSGPESRSTPITSFASGSLRESGYSYISPLLDCDVSSTVSEEISQRMKRTVETKIAELEKKHLATHVSVYFRDLNNGPWFGINDDVAFSPASLLKVPAMMAVYKIAEEDPEFLYYQLPFTTSLRMHNDVKGNLELPSEYLPPDNLIPGEEYNVMELLERMVAYSDNDAFDLLLQHIPSDVLEGVHKDLGIVYPDQETPDDYISVKSYSSLFRVLYNASYLNRIHSEEALRMLTGATFDIGLAGGVGAEIDVANKFGVKHLPTAQDEFQLHDCGIIYHPKGPYLLCVMTRGTNIDSLSNSLIEISRVVYENIK
jgi:beta-lactamase class A